MWRQLGRKLPLLMALGLTACGSGLDEGQTGFVEGFFGGIMVDEPRAALVGRDVLSAGGNAVDAAVAAYFTMAVTMPGGASLGGGGVCLVHDRPNSRVEVIEFHARPPAGGGSSVTVAVPGNVRGMFLAHARYGRLNWSDLLVPAEVFARDGHAISRAFARDLDNNSAALRADPEARRVFGLDNPEIAEGQVVRQFELAAALTVIRTRGAGEFYNGQLAQQFANAVRQTGAAMDSSDLRDYRPQLVPPIEFELGDEQIYFPPLPADGGLLAAQIWAAGHGDDRYSDGDPGQRAHLLAEIGARAYAARARASVDGAPGVNPVSERAITNLVAGHDRNRRGPVVGGVPAIADYSAEGGHDGASLVAVDRQGQAIACSYTLNRPFGVAKVAPGTGILLAATDRGNGASAPSAVMVANPVTDQIFFAATMSGGSPATLAAVALETFDAGRDFGAAVSQARAYNTGSPDIVVAESELPSRVKDFLESAGYAVRTQDGLGRVNGFRCPVGLPREPNCQFIAEPRAHGLAASADEQ